MPTDDDAPVQLTKADVDRLWNANDYEAIERARQAGQLLDLMTGTTADERDATAAQGLTT